MIKARPTGLDLLLAWPGHFLVYLGEREADGEEVSPGHVAGLSLAEPGGARSKLVGCHEGRLASHPNLAHPLLATAQLSSPRLSEARLQG